ncbi:hypothetical protein Taro_006230, partial [Colocasia esculenta]|nr:hypothetical protein [Colocasia esculenta]
LLGRGLSPLPLCPVTVSVPGAAGGPVRVESSSRPVAVAVVLSLALSSSPCRRRRWSCSGGVPPRPVAVAVVPFWWAVFAAPTMVGGSCLLSEGFSPFSMEGFFSGTDGCSTGIPEFRQCLFISFVPFFPKLLSMIFAEACPFGVRRSCYTPSFWWSFLRIRVPSDGAFLFAQVWAEADDSEGAFQTKHVMCLYWTPSRYPPWWDTGDIGLARELGIIRTFSLDVRLPSYLFRCSVSWQPLTVGGGFRCSLRSPLLKFLLVWPVALACGWGYGWLSLD